MRTYLFNVVFALDILASALTGGIPGESLSGRAGAAQIEDKLRGRIFAPIIDVIMHMLGQFPTWQGHCRHAIDGDIARAKAVIADDSRV